MPLPQYCNSPKTIPRPPPTPLAPQPTLFPGPYSLEPQKQVVRILLECFLVLEKRISVQIGVFTLWYKIILCRISVTDWISLRVDSLTLTWFGEVAFQWGFNALFQEFKRMSDLKAHMRYHTGNLLRCKDCGKGFPRMQQLRIHQVQKE